MQVVDQIPIEAVLGDDVNGACGDQTQPGIKDGQRKEAVMLRTKELSRSQGNQRAPLMSFIYS